MDNRDSIKALGEWLCSTAPTPSAKSMMQASMDMIYQQDYYLVTKLCEGLDFIPEISMCTIEGAKESYKKFNKTFVEASHLSEENKKEMSAQIDQNAEKLKQHWIDKLINKGIRIKK